MSPRRFLSPALFWITGVLAIVFVVLGAHSGAGAKPESTEAKYLSPGEMVFSVDGRFLYVVCERSNEVLIVDPKLATVVQRIAVGSVPRGLALSPDGSQLFVTNSNDDTVSAIDTTALKITRTLHTGFEPVDVAVDHDGQTLYTANRLSNDISVIDLKSGEERKRLTAGRGSSYLTMSPDGKRLYGTHVYPKIMPTRQAPQSEVTVVDTQRQMVVDRLPLKNVAGLFHVAFSADGQLGVVAQLRPKNLIPLAHVEHGSVFGNSIALFGEGIDGVVQLPLDELERYFPMPYGVMITPDKSKLYVTSGGMSVISVISIPKLLAFTKTAPADVANDLSASANYVIARIPTGTNPRSLLLSRDSKLLYVTNRMDDTIGVIDTRTDKVISTIDLGGRKDYNALRRGERLFYNTKYAFQGHFSCANCHIDATFDGLEWDLEPDGFGKDIVDNRSMEDLSGTEPFKWNGGNPTLAQECGPRTEMFFYRSQSYNSAELADLVTFVFAIPLRPNRYRLPAGELTPAQERGKGIFERTTYKDGRPIPQQNQCAYCHSGPKYTNQKLFDVGSSKPTDRSPLVDVPQLTNVVYSPPYLHDGSAHSLEEIWTVFNPKDTHGVTNDLTKDELNDLIEYLRTL
ncbi:MAG: beta-propeller fold lactonase family protein [Terriglobales bacterium]